VLSKWIVVALAISILLNGYLLKGIAAGLGLGLGLVRKEGDGVRFSDGEEVEADVKIKRVGEEEEVERERKVKVKKSAVVPTFTLEDVDRRLATSPTVRKRRGTLGSSVQSPVSSPVVQAGAFQFPSSPAPPSVPAPAPVRTATVPVPVSVSVPTTTTPTSLSDEIEVVVRSLKECVDIYENGPRPASLALDLLNDEEVIMLAQHGKIAAYALEKVLGPERLERAVRVRRAVICELIFILSFFDEHWADGLFFFSFFFLKRGRRTRRRWSMRISR
jgi:hydroxymethylglutaryl-CoA reductase (NADPH)